jgi:hypothetical protein
MKITRVTGAVVALTIGAAALAVAQRATHAPATPTHPVTSNRPTTPMATPSATPNTFKGIAGRLGTTPEALESAYTAAQQTNPKLTRGQFIAANVLAKNLGGTDSAITTQAILDGLQSGKSIGQTLQGLGLSSSESAKAEQDANAAIRAANRKPETPAKPDSTR